MSAVGLKEAFRRLEDERLTATDGLALRTASRMLLVFLLLRISLAERLFGLAAVASLNSVLTEGLARLAGRYPALYARHRRWLITLAIAHLSATIHLLTLKGGRNIFALAEGSPALLLYWMCVGNGALYTALCSVVSRLSVAWSYRALPALAALALLRGGQLCGLLAQAPGAQLALERLFHSLSLINSLALPPLAHLGLQVPPPARQCRVVNAWAVVMLGVAVPLTVQARWEVARWRAHQRQNATAQDEGDEAWQQLLLSGPHWPLEALLCSTVTWCVASLALA